jgi:2-desacetyl-2-hydroxyethyl bacteriochlorophyllide A dehydrogenase
MRARAVQFAAPSEVELVDVEVAGPSREELAVRTLYSGISSGTELLAYRGEIDPDVALDETIGSLRGGFSYPFRYGYSCVGLVEQSGGGIAPGTPVFAFHPHQELFVCRADEAVGVSGIDPRIATMFPLVETAFQIVLDAGDVAGEPVVVMGLGVVGFVTALLLQRGGAEVIAVEPRRARREVATELGVTAVPLSDAPDRVKRFTGGDGVPLVVEVSGNPKALDSALGLLAHEGTALVASWYGRKPVTLPLGAEFHRRRLTIRSTQVSTIPARLSSRWNIPRRRRHVARLLAELPLKRLATHDFPFDRAADAFVALDRGDEDVIHIALEYDGH